MNVEEISKIIEVFAKSGLQEFSYEEGDVKLSLQGKQNAPAVSAAPVVMTAAPAPVQNPAPAPAAETAPAAEEKEGLIITSPPGRRVLRRPLRGGGALRNCGIHGAEGPDRSHCGGHEADE